MGNKDKRFTKLQAINLCNTFQFLVGMELPYEYDPVYIHHLQVVQVSKGEFDVVLVSGFTTIPEYIWDDIRPVTNMYLMDFLKVKRIKIIPDIIRG